MRPALHIVAIVLLLAYPAAVYYGLTHLGVRQLVLWLLPLALGIGLLRSGRGPRTWRATLLWLAAVAGPLLLGAALEEQRLVLITPVLINLALLWAFAGSLRTTTPLVERFARLQVRDLSPEEVAYCRTVTRVWSLFFVFNGGTAALLAWLAPASIWALYTGAIAYVLIGLLGGTEYVIRKWRFGRYGRSPIDRALRAILPQRQLSR